MKWLDKELLIALHDQLIQETGGHAGIRDHSLLESALYVPLQSFDGEEPYATIVEKAARLAYGLSANHAFVDGNKRISALSLLLILQSNGISVRELQRGELSGIFISLASGNATYEDLLRWVEERIIEPNN